MFHNVSSGDSTSGDSSRSVLQVELNTIASSFGCLSNKISDMHKALSTCPKNSLPENKSMERIASSLIAAHNEYIAQTGRSTSIILFVVQASLRPCICM